MSQPLLRERYDARSPDHGFTLIELMVVVLIISILLAIAIPTFIGARKRAQDRAAQTSLRDSVTAAKALYTDASSYVNASQSNLAASETALTFQTLPSDDHVVASIVDPPSGNDLFAVAVLSDSGTCWYVRDSVSLTGTNLGTRWAKDENVAAANCDGATAEGLADAMYLQRSPSTALEVTP